MKTKNKLTAVVRAMTMAILIALTACSGEEWMDKAADARPDNSRTVSVNINLPAGKPGYSETDTRTTTTTSWANGDELLMQVVLQEGETRVAEFITLTYNGTGWTVPEGAMLIAAETLTLDGELEVRIPEAVTGEVTASVQLYYAPECTWVDNGVALKADAMTTAPEYWTLIDGNWDITAARLRIHTGAEGDVVKLSATGFADTFNKKAGTYTATTDASGNAYFYGKMEEATSGFTVSVEEIMLDDGSTVSVDMPVLEASPLVPVTLTAGECYKVDAKEKREAAAAEANALVTGETGYKLAADGTYLVYNDKGLMAWRNSDNVLFTSVKLMANITLPTTDISVTDGQPDGSNWTPVGDPDTPYIGTFDGNGYTISRLRISSTSLFTGLVGYMYGGGTVKNLTLSDAVVYSTSDSTGGIVGYNYDGTVSGCTVSGSVTGVYSTGGIVGYNDDGTVSGCTVSGSVTGGVQTGGIAGVNQNGTVSGCTVSGSVTGDSETGGIVGYLYDSSSVVIACGNTATVAGSHDVGGIVGYIQNGSVTGCWTSNTQEKDYSGKNITEDKDGIGTMNSNATAPARYSFAKASAVTDEAISAMNSALTSAGSIYRWQAVTGSWPTLTTSD